MPAAAALGTSADLKVGQSAFAIGNPFGLDQWLSSGIISNRAYDAARLLKSEMCTDD
jgi:S1-C subfamily serine protease